MGTQDGGKRGRETEEMIGVGEDEEGGGIQYIKEAGNSRKMREMVNDNESG